MDEFPEEGPMAELYLHEAEGRAAMEKRTGLDLSYEFVMPFPGRRQLPEVVTFVQTIATSMDPNGVNIALRRHLLRFAFEQMGMDDVGHAVEECIPDDPIPGGIGPQEPVEDPSTGDLTLKPPGTTIYPAKKLNVPPGDRPRGAKQGTTIGGKPTSPARESEWIPAELRGPLGEFTDESAELFRRLVSEPAVVATLALANSNGTSAGS